MSTAGNDTGNTCRLSSNPCKTIDHAVSVASTGATVKVAAGTYAEQLTIGKNVTILGTMTRPGGTPATIIEPDSVSQNASRNGVAIDAIVYWTSGVTAGNLTNFQVNGTNASSSITDCNPDYVGVYYQDASGAMTTDQVTAIKNPPDLSGCQGGLGVYVTNDASGTPASNVKMTTVTVDDYNKNGITCKDIGTTCTITKSTVTGIGATPLIAQNGIEVFNASANISSTKVSGNSYTSPYYCPDSGATCDPNGGGDGVPGPGTTYYTRQESWSSMPGTSSSRTTRSRRTTRTSMPGTTRRTSAAPRHRRVRGRSPVTP